jgi:drug/metabolite transporter (DMT)-like permease
MTAIAAVSPPSHPVRAAVWMIGAIASFSLMAVAGREIAAELNTFELMMYRSFVGLIVVSALLAMKGGFGQVRTRRVGLHTARNLSHFTGQNLWFYGVATIPFGQLVALEFTSPLWVALLAPLFLGERLTKWRILAACLGFVGILIVARPGQIDLGAGHLAGLLAAVGFAGSILTTKKLSTTETTLCILFWMTVSQAIMGMVAAGAAAAYSDGSAWAIAVPSWGMTPWVALVGLCGMTAHFSLTTALSHADASVVSPMEFMRLPLLSVVGLALYDEPLELAVFLGGALILTGNLINIRAEGKARRQAKHRKEQPVDGRAEV